MKLTQQMKEVKKYKNCCQFHQHLTCAFFVRKLIQSQTLSREKLLKILSYEKCMRKMLMKLTPNVRPIATTGNERFCVRCFRFSPFCLILLYSESADKLTFT